MKIAFILEGKVVATYVEQTSPDYLFDVRFKECPDHVEINWLYNYETNLFSEPEPVPQPEPLTSFGRVITVLAFRLRFTPSERIALKLASFGNTAGAAAVAVSMEDIMSAGYINLDHPETIEGTNELESAGLIGVGRSSEILSPPVHSAELLVQSRLMYGLPSVPTQEELSLNNGKGYTPLEYSEVLGLI